MKKILFLMLVAVMLRSPYIKAQDEVNKQIHVKIEREVNGKKTKIDTTLNSEADFQKYMQEQELQNDGASSVDVDVSSEQVQKRLEEMEETLHESSKELKKFSRELEMELDKLKDGIDIDVNGRHYQFDFDIDSEKLERIEKEAMRAFDFDIDTTGEGFRINFDYKGLSPEAERDIKRNIEQAEKEIEKAMRELENGNMRIHIDINDSKPKNRIKEKKTVITKDKKNSNSTTSSLMINVFPNPSKGDFTVEATCEGKKQITMEVVNARGQTVWMIQQDNFEGKMNQELKLGAMGKGTYTLTVKYGGSKQVQKLIVE